MLSVFRGGQFGSIQNLPRGCAIMILRGGSHSFFPTMIYGGEEGCRKFPTKMTSSIGGGGGGGGATIFFLKKEKEMKICCWTLL